MTIIETDDPFTEAIRAYRADDEVREFVHADGSHTFIMRDPVPEYANPREDDGNVAHLVMCHRDYRTLDASDSGIDDARSRWGDESPMVDRYVAMFRPDIAHYEARWEVTGYSQSDWAYGYGYVLSDDMTKAWGDAPFTRDDARKAFAQEVDVYGQFFRGDVYGVAHISRGAPVVIYGEFGAYVDGFDAVIDDVWGMLAYESHEAMAAEMTDSPILETIY